jgi:cytochrome P450 family 106
MELTSPPEASVVLEVSDSQIAVDALTRDELRPVVDIAEPLLRTAKSVPALILLSGQEHAEQRRRVSRAFTQRALEVWTERFDAIAASVAPTLPHGDVIDLAEVFARPLTSRCVLTFLGMTTGCAPDVVKLARLALDSSASRHARMLALMKLQRLARPTIERSSAEEEHSTQASALSDVLRRCGATTDGILGVTMSLLTGGVELAARAMIACLMESPAATLESDEAIDARIRNAGVIPSTDRVANRETVVGGSELCAGQRIRVDLASTDRNLTFGIGPHFCLGAAWTRLMCKVGFHELHRRFGDVEVVRVVSSPRDARPGGPLSAYVRRAATSRGH